MWASLAVNVLVVHRMLAKDAQASCIASCFVVCAVQEFDSTTESEISIINRLAAERQDNVMWREFRTRLLRNMGLVSAGRSSASFLGDDV